MDASVKKALFCNLVLVANADGAMNALEQQFVRDFVTRAGIEPDEAQRWLADTRAAGGNFMPLPEAISAEQALAVMVGSVSADGRLEDAERAALVAWARSAGIDAPTLRRVVHEKWRADVLDELFGETAVKSTPGLRLLAIADGFAKLDATLEACKEFGHERVALDDITARAVSPDVVVFHATEERVPTLALLERLRRATADVPIVCILDRHQAFQVSYLLENGVTGCIVEPVYPGELTRTLERARPSPKQA